MANKKSAQKRIITNEKSRVRNSGVKSMIRTSVKNIVKLLSGKGEVNKELVTENHKKFIKTIDNASSKGIIHKKTAARKKSRIAKKVNAALQ